MASIGNHPEIVTLLVENSANLNITDNGGNTPLLEAAREKNMAVVRELVWSLCDLKVPVRSLGGQTVVEWAEKWGQDTLADYLTNQAPREQVRLASCAYDAITYSSTRLFSAWL